MGKWVLRLSFLSYQFPIFYDFKPVPTEGELEFIEPNSIVDPHLIAPHKGLFYSFPGIETQAVHAERPTQIQDQGYGKIRLVYSALNGPIGQIGKSRTVVAVDDFGEQVYSYAKIGINPPPSVNRSQGQILLRYEYGLSPALFRSVI